MPTTPGENKRIVRRTRDEVEERGTLDAMDDIFAEDIVVHTPAGDFSGHEDRTEW